MTDPISLDAAREARTPHILGAAICLGCRYGRNESWLAIAPPGTTQIECPSCGLNKGVWRTLLNPPPPHITYICNCGNDAFFVLPRSIVCQTCGVETAFEDLEG